MSMQRFLRGLCFALFLLLCGLSASAQTDVDTQSDRGIVIQPAGLNEIPEGYSPTTGRLLSEYADVPAECTGLAATGKYTPMLIQIDNTDGGVGYRAPWGSEYADVVYETPLYRSGVTRISMLFSDVLPTFVGPCRSARVEHVWIREEWDCGFIYYGQQTYKGTNVVEEFKKLGANQKGLLFSCIVSNTKPWMKYVTKRKGLKSPHDKGVNMARISELMPEDYPFPNHAFRFTDTVPEGGEDAAVIYVSWGNALYDSILRYDRQSGLYSRYVSRKKGDAQLYVDFDTGEAITFRNVIVQVISCSYPSSDAPLPTMLGTGNADYFLGGKHYSGVWNRESLSDRTVFYGEDGTEINLLPGRTLIITLDCNTKGRALSYESE